jgi:hypothetical protein
MVGDVASRGVAAQRPGKAPTLACRDESLHAGQPILVVRFDATHRLRTDAINIAFGVLPENAKADTKICPDGLTQTCGLALDAKGTCATGVVTCVGNRWGECSIQPAMVDSCVPGNDDTCDGKPNVGCP